MKNHLLFLPNHLVWVQCHCQVATKLYFPFQYLYIHKLINISKYEASSIVEAGHDELDLSDYATVKNDSYVSAEDEFFLKEESFIFKKTLNKMMKTMSTTERRLWDMKSKGLKPKEIRDSLNMTQKEYNSIMKRLKNMWNDFSQDASAHSHREHLYKL